MIGIYKIENKINGMVYVGQSLNITERWKEHKKQLQNNNHKNCHLQNAWNKYGEENFEFEIIQECKDRNELNYWETYWCDYYRPNVYNLGHTGNAHDTSEETRIKMSDCKIGNKNGFYGKHHSKEAIKKISIAGKRPCSDMTKQKISKARKGKPNTWQLGVKRPYHIMKNCIEAHKIKIVQLDINGNFIKEWGSTRDACRELGLHNGNICKVLKNKRNHTGGYKWQYAEEYYKKENYLR